MNERDALRLHTALIRENQNAVEQPRTESEDKPDEQAVSDGPTTEKTTEDLFQEDISE
jgi:hypothetical protein